MIISLFYVYLKKDNKNERKREKENKYKREILSIIY